MTIVSRHYLMVNQKMEVPCANIQLYRKCMVGVDLVDGVIALYRSLI